LCVLSGRGLCDRLITRPEESHRLWCVLVCNLGTSRMRRLKLIKGCKCRIEKVLVVVVKELRYADHAFPLYTLDCYRFLFLEISLV
jgi:hypothetical protein